jgi:hypothetical protein
MEAATFLSFIRTLHDYEYPVDETMKEIHSRLSI